MAGAAPIGGVISSLSAVRLSGCCFAFFFSLLVDCIVRDVCDVCVSLIVRGVVVIVCSVFVFFVFVFI